MRTFRINHIYDLYPLYQVIYGRGLESKAFEVSKLSYMLQDVYRYYGFCWELSIYELMGGESEHKKLFPFTDLPIKSYVCTDLHESEGVQSRDIRTVVLPEDVNLTLAFYYSLGTILGDNYSPPTRNIVSQSICNILRGLTHNKTKDKGIKLAYFHISDPYLSSEYIYTRADISQDMEFSIPIWSKLHDLLSPDELNPGLSLTLSIRTQYDRLNGYNINTMENICARDRNNKVIAKFYIKQPLVIRNWTEHEVMDIIGSSESPIDHIFLFNSSIRDYAFNVQQLNNIEDIVDETSVNTMATDVIIAL